MSVVSTLISDRATAHATDSLITRFSDDGRREALEWEQTKIVPVRAWRGAMSYYGLARVDGQWSTLEWLRQQAARAGEYGSPADFAKNTANALNAALTGFVARLGSKAGIGVHFSAYERFDDRWVPELFHITNWADPSYNNLRPEGVGQSRETCRILYPEVPERRYGDKDIRLAVGAKLGQGIWLRYNNGDPQLYNTAAAALQQMFTALASRGVLRNKNNPETIRSVAKRSVDVVCAIQRDFCAEDKRVVGGRVHDLLITPNGDFSSSSGDS